MEIASKHYEEQPLSFPYTQLKVAYDQGRSAMWYYMNPEPRPCFTLKLLEEINSFQEQIVRLSDQFSFKYLILTSNISGVFSLGGDLNHFNHLIISKNEEGLFKYAKSCIDVMYANLVGLECDITTISLVQGDALGGGFESAIANNVVIAEKSANFGFPEIRFNMFPGMGSFSILSRKIGSAMAERMILSGKLYTSTELFEMGLVDILVEDGQGEIAVNNYLKRMQNSNNGFSALQKAKSHSNPITYDELLKIVEVWVDAALKLNSRDLRMMERLASRQTKI